MAKKEPFVRTSSTRGRKPFEPTPEQRKLVLTLCGYGVPEITIANELKIDPKTLRKCFREELDHGMAKANMLVAESLFKKALGDGNGSVAAAIFWAKTRLCWRETNRTEHSGPDGKPIEIETSQKNLDVRDLTAAQREQLKDILAVVMEKNEGEEEDGEDE